MGKVITVSAFKGGVGKTTTATNIAASIKKLDKSKKVVLVDFDFQANATMSYGYNPDKLKKNIYEAIHETISIKDAILHHNSGIDIIPSTFDLASFDLDLYDDEEEKFPKKQQPYILNKLLEPIKNSYDYIICDAGPSLSLMATNYIVATDKFVVTLSPGNFALEGAIKFINHIKTIKNGYCKSLKYDINILVTMFDSRTNLSIDTLQQARRYADKNNIYIPDTVISRTVRFTNAQTYHATPLVLVENSEYAEQYEKITKELILNVT